MVEKQYASLWCHFGYILTFAYTINVEIEDYHTSNYGVCSFSFSALRMPHFSSKAYMFLDTSTLVNTYGIYNCCEK